MSTVDEVKQKLDIVEVIGQYVKLTKAGRNFKRYVRSITKKPLLSMFFQNGSHGTVLAPVAPAAMFLPSWMKKEGLDFGETLRLLADKTGIAMPSKIEGRTEKDEKENYSRWTMRRSNIITTCWLIRHRRKSEKLPAGARSDDKIDQWFPTRR